MSNKNKKISLFQEYSKVIKNQKGAFGIILGSLLISVLVDIASPLFYKDLANVFAQNFSETGYEIALWAIISLIIAYSIQFVVWRTLEWFIIPFQVGGMNQISLYAFDVLTRQKYMFFQNEFSGSLIKKHGRFVSEFEQIMDWIFFTAWNNILAIVFAFVVFSMHDMYFAGIFFLWCVVFLLISGYGFYYKFKFDKKRAKVESQVGALFSDTFSNIFTVKTAQIEKSEKKNIFNKLKDLYAVTKISWHITSFMFGVQALLMVGIEIYMLFEMLEKWEIGTFSIGEFVLIQTVLFLIFDKVWNFGMSLRSLFTSVANASEMLDIINIANIEKNEEGSQNMKIVKGEIFLKNIHFTHNGDNGDTSLFTDFSLHIKAGEHIALVGESGSGKTTITNLLFRFFTPQKGEILFDGVLSEQYTLESLRSQISLVPQNPEMFHRTLRDNIALGREVSDEEIWEALRKSQSEKFVKNLPRGIYTMIGERGVKLSGGEKQRIAIARAFIDNAPIVILDEATSALDSITENEIQKGIAELIKNKTAIVIAHRLSTVKKVDRIVVMNNGKIVEEGNHEELVQKESLYSTMWSHQVF